ncbi:MAG: glutathione S-transferase family protein [Burkholderiales bacterium]|nr:glutathione S-transferase family protein [Burkholderiales bacterium]
MSLKLYFSPGACSFVPHSLLQLSGASYEPIMVKLHKGEQHGDEYKAINPRGQVPVLVDNGQVMTQIVAIILYLDQKFPECHFLPTASFARAKAIETLAWMNNTIHPTFTHIFMPHKFSDQADVQANLKVFNTQIYKGLLSELESLVQSSATPWLFGENIGPVDAYALTLTRWGSIAGIDPSTYPALWAHVQKVSANEAISAVIERERLQLNLYKPS